MSAPTIEEFVGRGMRAQNSVDRQTTLWATPDTAKFGAFVERLDLWCLSQRGAVTFYVQRTLTVRVQKGTRGKTTEQRGWAVSIVRGGTSATTFTGGSMVELVKVGDQWLDKQQRRAKK
jgi:hypothetical protein